MPILNNELISYNLIYTGDRENLIKELLDNNIEKYIFLNSRLLVIYAFVNFKEDILKNIEQIVWWERAYHMSSLIEISEDISDGNSAISSVDISSIGKSLYSNLSGKGVVIAVIDSGIDYLNEDFINDDGTSKILYLWDQESDYSEPPDNMIFGSEFTREDINRAIEENNPNLSRDETGTGTMAAGVISSQGRKNFNYRGIAPNVDLIVVKLRTYISMYQEGRINYKNTDFLVAISYVIEKIKRLSRPVIINFSLGVLSGRSSIYTLLNTFDELYQTGFVVVCGAGNQGNTDIHYSNTLYEGETTDVTFQVGDDKNLDIVVDGYGGDKFDIALISPLGEISNIISYRPTYNRYSGKFNLENVDYSISYSYPWISTASLQVIINLRNVFSGIWTIRLIGREIIDGIFDVYLPNKNLISNETRFIDSDSTATITRYALMREGITVGTYDTRSNSIWVGSSKDQMIFKGSVLDIVAPGVNIVTNYLDNTLRSGTGTGISSSVVCAVIALLIEFIMAQTNFYKLSISSEPIKTYLMLGATQKPIYKYPNISYGYGVLNYEKTLERISENL